MIDFFSNFNLYGFTIGIAIVVGLLLSEKKAKEYGIDENEYWQTVLWVMVGGMVGARVWHVVTDYYLYVDDPLQMIKVWNGGMSILGGVVGGIIGLWFWTWHAARNAKRTSDYARLPASTRGEPARQGLRIMKYSDLSVFGLPIAQSIGRWGNYFNQELYGLPTDLPWGIGISSELGVMSSERYHPLFLYESLLTLMFGVGVWLLVSRQQAMPTGRQAVGSSVGSGKLFFSYIAYYSFIRFWLDFLRPEKAMVGETGLGINQVVLLAVWLIIVLWLLRKRITNYEN